MVLDRMSSFIEDKIKPEQTRQFIYANDTALAAQGTTFHEVEGKLSRAL